jgi:CRISPR/Cas system-associated exonuclease Cas4 (RecB family)
MPQQITAWSFSRYSVYKQCPLKAKLKFIDKIKEPSNAAMERGAKIHDLAEGYIKGTVVRIPKELNEFKELFQHLRKQYKKAINGMVVEDTWAFTKNWDETVWNDWVHCWVRIKLDCAEHEDETTLLINDWKTGKYRTDNSEDYIEQLELYALAALLLYEHVEVVKPRLVYLDHGIIYPIPGSDEELVFTRDDITKLKKLWEKRVKPMLRDKTFAPRPNNFCHWCHFRKSNVAHGGGQCKY